MNTDNLDSVWVVTNSKDDGQVETAVYSNESDAEHFFNEMKDRYGAEAKVYINKNTIVKRDPEAKTNEAPWGMLRMDIHSEFVEGLLEEMDLPDNIKPCVAEKFVCEKIDLLRKRTASNIEKIVKDEAVKEIESTLAEWLETQAMED